MTNQVQVSMNQDTYKLLQELCVPPDDINTVLNKLLYSSGKIKSPALLDVEGEMKHRSFEEEIKATEDGVYSGSGVSP
jgi:hypothetical protein